jgi:Kef-type K+ transport system membrane component KefB
MSSGFPIAWAKGPLAQYRVMDLSTHNFLCFLRIADLNTVHLPLALLLIFGVAKLFANICERFGQPGLVGEIVAGTLLGPSLLNWVRPDDVLTALAEMGVMFLLFRVGLEVNASELMGVGKTALIVAILGVVLPFVLGWTVMTLAGVSRIEAIFVGAALVATSVGITAQVLASKGLLQERASQIILAAAVIDDILGLLALALVSSMAKGRINLVSLVTTGLIAGGFTVLVAKYGTRTFQRVVPRIENKLAVEEGQFHLTLIVLFALALAAVYVGVAAIVGAFLAGLALSETVNRRVRDLAHGITELLVPFFLAGIGLQLDLSAFADRRTLTLTAVICAVAVLSKFLGCGLGTLSLGRPDMLRVGVGMIPRGEVGMVVAQIGLNMGVIEKPVYAVVVFMAIATTLVAPPMLKYAYRNCQPRAPKEDFTIA